MSLATFIIVLVAAALHATWNAIVKGGADKLMTTVLVAGASALLAIAVLPFLDTPAPASWPFIAMSSLLQLGYFLLISQIYNVSDMSLAYPLMRGAAPLIVALGSVAALGEHLGPTAWLGVTVICSGVLSMAIGTSPGSGGGILLALLNACVIAAYTMVDGEGVRRSGAPAAYTLWLSLLTGIPLVAGALASRRAAFLSYAARNWHYGLVGGIGTVVAYGLALWAMTTAPIPLISALRETSIVFGAIISATVLRERVARQRVLAALVIAGGAVVLQLT